MTRSTIDLAVLPADRHIAGLAAAAVGLTLAEAAIPLPVPGIKPGLANIVTLMVLYRYGWRTAAWVTLLRIVGGALALGTFLTPTFVMSFTGGLASLCSLALLVRLPRRWMGPVGVSILAALAHIGTQLLVVNAWLLPGVSLIGLLPLLFGAAWLTGLVNGFVAARLLEHGPGVESLAEAAT